jgi:hypothetical protein
MSFFATIGKVFGTDKAIEKVIDTASTGIDKLFYTDEERAEDGRKERAEARSMIIEWMKNSQGQNLARRILAFMITGTWLFLYLFSAAIDAVSPWVNSESISTALISSGSAISARADQMGGAVTIIIGFYFAAPHLGTIIGPALNMFSKKK